MNKFCSKSILIVILLFVPVMSMAGNVHNIPQASVSVYFSPDGGCTEAIVAALDNAKVEILVQAYSFTSSPIAQALVKAQKRGIRVQVILDKSQKRERYTSATFLSNAGIPTFIDDAHAIAHNKVIIIDHATVITGSFNFTKAAEERNAENLLIIHSNTLATKYLDNWTKHRGHSEAYVRAE
ncbi:MAG: Phospholipase D [Syntrophus sp. SKADARSKE-3]|nr:Phospholipase D [Syntrophus sp. SKADARSKE-3]